MQTTYQGYQPTYSSIAGQLTDKSEWFSHMNHHEGCEMNETCTITLFANKL